MRDLATLHRLGHVWQHNSKELSNELLAHTCRDHCPTITSVFEFIKPKQSPSECRAAQPLPQPCPPQLFPPLPPQDELTNKIITEWDEDFGFRNIEEVGCAVCGQLKLRREMAPLKSMANYLHVLTQPGVTRKERKSNTEAMTELKGPVIDHNCDQVCETCRRSLRDGKVPRISLANGFWLGAVPQELKTLNFMEKLLIQKIRTNCCFVKVSSGMRKMISHVIAFEAPVTKVYD
ncbi:hypothetical protein K435DRAFT_698214, partial [Dendrothele bispora CBS 962.96]